MICTSLRDNPIAALRKELPHAVSVLILVTLSFVDGHREHLSHTVIHSLYATFVVGMLGFCRNLAHAVQLVRGEQ